jgi:hypothetical protein
MPLIGAQILTIGRPRLKSQDELEQSEWTVTDLEERLLPASNANTNAELVGPQSLDP